MIFGYAENLHYFEFIQQARLISVFYIRQLYYFTVNTQQLPINLFSAFSGKIPEFCILHSERLLHGSSLSGTTFG